MKRLAAILAVGFLALLLAWPGRADFKSQVPWSEGTWTPVLAGATTPGTFTYTTQTGRFVQIGDTVCITGRVTAASNTATSGGNMQVTGLPVTSSGVNGNRSVIAIGHAGNIVHGTGYTQFAGIIGPSAVVIGLVETGSNLTTGNVAATNVAGTADISISGCYYTGS